MNATAPFTMSCRNVLGGLTPWMQPYALPALAALTYLALGGLWIMVSDHVAAQLFTSQEHLSRFQTYKGGVFVAASALLIFVLLRLAGRRRDTQDAKTASPRLNRWPLSVLLLMLVMATGVPMIGLMAYGVSREAERDTGRANHLITGLTEVSAADTLSFLAETGRVADMLLRRPQLRDLDPGRCDPVLGDVLAVRPELANIVTLKLDGQVVCSATLPAPATQPASWRAALEAGAPMAISPPLNDAESGTWRVTLSYPLRGPSGLSGAVQLSVLLTAFHPMVTSALPEGGVAALLDGQGHVIAHSAAMAHSHLGSPVGQRLQDRRITDHIVANRKGLSEAPVRGLDGIERVYAFQAVGDSGWFATTGIPAETMYGQARRNALRVALGSLAVLALSTWLVVLITRRIAAPIQALTRTAQHVALGQFDLRAPTNGPLEVAQVSAGFNRMLDRIPAMEAQLRDSEARLRSLVEMAPDGILMQQGGRLVYANPSFRDMLGLPAEVAPQDISLTGLVAPEHRALVDDRLARLEEQPASAPALEVWMCRSDGSRIEVELSCSSVRLQGRVMVQSHLRNMTSRNQARRELELANETLEARIHDRTSELRAANQALEAFAYSVAHDLRAPLGSISGFSQALADCVSRGETSKAGHYTSRIVHNAARMGAMIEGLLKLSRASRGQLDCRPVDMRRLVEEVISEQEAGAGVDISIGDLPSTMADPDTIRQVWTNLVSNAIKYSARAAHPRIAISSRAEGCETVFTVADNGTGFDEAGAGKLFGVFQRLASAQDYQGTGVGLAIAKRIVERHGGRIWAQGTPGEGASFSFSLPRDCACCRIGLDVPQA